MINNLLLIFGAFNVFGTKHADLGAFDISDVTTLRHLIRNAIIAEEEGLIIGSPDISPFDFLRVGEQPLLASIVRLSFHDCAGLNFDEPNNSDFAYCNGCINLNDPQHAGLEDGAIIPLESICDLYSHKGLTYADCWALAATFALELSAENAMYPFKSFGIDTQMNPLEIKPGDIPYYIGRDDCQTSPTTSTEKTVLFPDAMLGWDHIEQYFKQRFPNMNNRDIVALVAGGHSLGRGHLKISGFSGAWDPTPQGLDNGILQMLIDKSALTNLIDITHDFFQTKAIENCVDCKPQWSLLFDQVIVDQFGLPSAKNFMMLNTDIALAFDISSWIEYGKENEIDCHTVAGHVCGNKTVIIGGYEPEQPCNKNKYINDMNENEICEFKQCPVQCPSMIKGITNEEMLSIIMEEGVENLDPNSKCIRAFVEEFAVSNAAFVSAFVDAFIKMITAGYIDKNGEILLDVLE